MLHLFGTWTLLLLLGTLAAGDRRPKNLVIVLEPISPATPILNGCGTGCGVLPMRVAHVMEGRGSGWGSNCGCGHAGLLAGPPTDREDYDDFGFEDFSEDDDDDDDDAHDRSSNGGHRRHCNSTACSGRFGTKLAKFAGVSIVWSAGYGREFSFLNMTRARFEFQATADVACPGEYVNSTGVVAMDALPTSHTVTGSFISAGQCPNCTQCSIAAGMEVSVQNGTAGSLFLSREARITTDFSNEFGPQKRRFMWNINNYTALRFEGQSLTVNDFDFFSYKQQKYKLPKSEKPWGILQMSDDDRRDLATAIGATEVMKYDDRIEAFVQVSGSFSDFETELPALHHLDRHSARKLHISEWGSNCKKAIVHTKIPNATSLALMGLRVPNVLGTPSFLMSVDRMDDVGGLVNDAIFRFRVYHPNCSRLKVFSYHGNATEPTEITAEGGNSTLIATNGTFDITVLRTSTFAGYAVAEPDVVSQPQDSSAASASASVSPSPASPVVPAASPEAASAGSSAPVMVFVLAGVGACIAVLVVVGGTWLYCRRQRLASPRQHMASVDDCPFDPPSKYMV